MALTPDGWHVAMIQSAPRPGTEGRMYNMANGSVRVFWKTGDLRTGPSIWYRQGGMLRVSNNGTYACFPVYPGNPAGQPTDPWSAALAVDFVTCSCPTQLFDLKAFLISQDHDIEGARGIQDLDMNTDGTVIYAVVPFHKKGDAAARRENPIRVAVIEIHPRKTEMILHSVAAQGERHYPFLSLTTNSSGGSFTYKGAAEDGKTIVTWVHTSSWMSTTGHFQIIPNAFSGDNMETSRGGPVLAAKGDLPLVFIQPREGGAIVGYNWQARETREYGPRNNDALFAPVRADSRFASGDGEHLFYSGKDGFVWYPLQKQPHRFLPAETVSRFELPGFNNGFLSEDGSTMLLHKITGGVKRLVLYKASAN